MMAKYEIFKVENLPILNDCSAMNEKACMSKEHKKAFNIASDSNGGLSSDILPESYNIQGESEKSPFKWDDVPYLFATADGMIYGVLQDEDVKTFSVVADVNGSKNPNTVRKDLYKFRYSGNGLLADVSSELEQVNKCSIDSLDECKTEEACWALDGVPVSGTDDCPEIYWFNGKCSETGGSRGPWYCR